MLNLSRRDFVVSTAMAAALGLNARLAVSPAFAQKTPDPAKGLVTYKVGAAEVTGGHSLASPPVTNDFAAVSGR